METRVYSVWEDCHGVVSHWSTSELAYAEAESIVDEMYDGDQSAIGILVGVEAVAVDSMSFVYGSSWRGGKHFREAGE